MFEALIAFQEKILQRFGIDIRVWNIDVNTSHDPTRDGMNYNIIVTGDCSFSGCVHVQTSTKEISVLLSSFHSMPDKPKPQSLSETIACATH